jgi:PAS domain S-box-containing protein
MRHQAAGARGDGRVEAPTLLGGERLEVFDVVPASIAVLIGPDHVFRYANRQYRDVVGVDRKLVGLPVREALPEIAGQGFVELLDEVYRTGEPCYGNEVPVRIDRAGNGGPHQAWFNFAYIAIRNEAGETEGILSHGTEVTLSVAARHRVEELVRDLELERASLETIIERMPAGVVLSDPSGAITAANSTWRKFFGLPPDEIPDLRAWKVFEGRRPNGTPLRPEEYPLARSIISGEIVRGDHLLFTRADGQDRTIDVSSAPIRDESGAVVMGVAMFTDVTERLQLQEEVASRQTIEQVQDRLHQVFEAASDGLWVLDEHGKTAFVNPAACALTGWSADEVLGRSSHELIHHTRPDGSAYPLDECPTYRSVIDAIPCRVDDEVFWRKDGSSFPVEYTSTPIVVDGIPRGAVQVFRDITEQRRAEDRKADFFANASHELRTPLTAIGGFAATLVDRWDDLPDEQRLDFVNIIAEQSSRMSRLINDVLTLSKLERGKLVVEPEAIDLRQAVDAVVRAFPDERIEVHGAPNTFATCDRDHLEQMLLNYIDNAIKYGGRPIAIHVGSEDGSARIEVADPGRGVPEHFRPRLFERFSQAERRPQGSGTGLGLSIVRNLAQAQGGDAWFEPLEPQGSRFLLRLPRPD